MQKFKKMNLKNQKRKSKTQNQKKITVEQNEPINSSENIEKKIPHQQLKIKHKIILLRKKQKIQT